jgi:6-phosphogluconolactonase
LIAERARAAIAARGRFVVALSGGSTPAAMFRCLAQEAIDWSHVFVAQTDERVAPVGSQHRNLTQLRAALVDAVPIPPGQVLAMPVERADLAGAARDYQRRLGQAAGVPVVFDLVQLGLGEDGHTASLLPGDSALDVVDADVALTGEYQGWRRMTLTLPAINRARGILWLATGAEKSAVVARLLRGNERIPAGRITRASALLLMDQAAAGCRN